MLNRFLVIGLGGSGTTTLRFLQQELKRRLAIIGIDRIPDSWSLMALDVRAGQAPADASERLEATEDITAFHALATSGLEYDNIRANFLPQQQAALGPWSPWPREVSVSLPDGAGQYRAIGRTLGLYYLNLLEKWIDSAIPKANADDQLREIAAKLGANTGDAAFTIPIVVSSIAGGSGAGLFLDVCDVLRAKGIGNNTIALLYSPEVFGSLADHEIARVHGNALGVISELMAGRWNSDADQGGEASLFGLAGLEPPVWARGPAITMVVGGENLGGLDPVDDAANPRIGYYESVGSTIASWFMSEAIQQKIRQFFFVQPPPVASATGLAGSVQSLSAVGFSSLGLGNTHLLDFGAEWIGRVAVDTLLLGTDDPGWVREQASVQYFTFLSRAKLSEFGEGTNQVIDALRGGPEKGSPRDAQISSWRDQFAKAWQTVTAGVAEWKKDMLGYRSREGIEKLEQEGIRVVARADAWARETQDRLAALAEEYTGRFGLLVTARILTLVDQDLERAAKGLRGEAADRHLNGSRQGLEKALAAAFGSRDAEYELSEGGAVRKALNSTFRALELEAEANLRDLAADLIDDLRSGFIATLHDALDTPAAGLQGSPTSAADLLAWEIDGRRDPTVRPSISDWPVADAAGRVAVPQRLRPISTTVLVDDVDDPHRGFVARIEGGLARRFPDLPDTAQRISRAAGEALRGLSASGQAAGAWDMKGDAVKGRLVQVKEYWVPRRVAEHQGRVAGPSLVAVAAAGDDILRHCREWIVGASGALAAEVKRTFNDLLATDDGRARFVSKLQEALELAKPFVRVEERSFHRTHQQLGSQEPPLDALVSNLPVTKKNDLFGKIDDLMTRAFHAEGIAQRAATGAKVSEIALSAFLWPPLDLPAFNSIVDPIAEDLLKRRNDPQRWKQFWEWKRTRRLDGFMPVPTAVRGDLLRGWFVADTLGLFRRVKPTPGSGGPEAWAERLWILDTLTESEVSFPFPLLTPLPRKEMLAAALESLPLALLHFGHMQDETMAANTVRPYRVLLRLGTAGAESDLPDDLGRWILEGAGKSHREFLKKKDSDRLAAISDPQRPWKDRKEEADTFLQGELDRHQALLAKPTRRTTGPGRDELATEITAALQGLLGAVREFEPEGYGEPNR